MRAEVLESDLVVDPTGSPTEVLGRVLQCLIPVENAFRHA